MKTIVLLIAFSALFTITATAQLNPPSLQDRIENNKKTGTPNNKPQGNQNISRPVTSVAYEVPNPPINTKETNSNPKNATEHPNICSAIFLRLTQDITGTATIMLVLVTFFLVCVTLYQSRLLRRELILTQRPKLRISAVVIKPSKLANTGPYRFFEKGQRIDGQFHINNIGGTPATITEILCLVDWRVTPLPMERPYEGGKGIPEIHVLNPGESIQISFQSERLSDSFDDRTIEMHRLYIMGWIEFRDDLKIKRRLNFCRQYDTGGSPCRFSPVIDPDYESYEENN